jgi:anaerobic magnesium-protoporphyrin IX monomethyl ester cyclase
MVGISTLFSTAFNNMLDLAEVVKNIKSEVFLIAGGNVPTVSYQDIFARTDKFNAICYGEGELPLYRLLTASDWSIYVEQDSSWITHSKVTSVGRYDFIHDLDEIPFDYSIIEQCDYELNPTIFYYPSFRSKGRSFNIMTSRGCPFKCVFCASHRTHGREMRYYSLERVKADIANLVNNYDIQVITIMDDHFMGDKKRAYEIVKFIGELGATAFFPNSLALYALDRKMLLALKDVGVDQLVLAVESGSDYVLKKVMHKPLKLEIVQRVVKDCREIGIYTDCNILIGLPGEQKRHIEETQKFLRTVGANWFRINVATPLIGSELHEICKEKNYFVADALEGNYKNAIICTDEFTSKFIQDISYDLNIELNFVYNSDMARGDYQTALIGFENAIIAKPTHAIALYYASICYRKLGDDTYAQKYLAAAQSAYSSESMWEKYFSYYQIDIFDSVAT